MQLQYDELENMKKKGYRALNSTLDRVPAVSTRIYVILQLLEGRIIVGHVVSGKPSRLRVC